MIYKKQNTILPLAGLIVLLLSLAFINPARTQEEFSGPVKYTVHAPDTVNTDEQFTVTVNFDIRKGWHIYAPLDANTNMGKVVTKVSYKLPDGVKAVGSLQLPKGGLVIYTGKGVKMTQKFKITKKIPKAKFSIIAVITYQCCNEEMCYPPVTEKVTINIDVK